MEKTIAIGSDHAGYKLKTEICCYLLDKGYAIKNFGAKNQDSVDYPDYAHPVAEEVQHKNTKLGILICHSGQGMSLTANKYKDVRAAVCWDMEIAKLARQHNNANILCLPAGFIDLHKATQILDAFLSENFEGGRHQRRVEKISCQT